MEMIKYERKIYRLLFCNNFHAELARTRSLFRGMLNFNCLGSLVDASGSNLVADTPDPDGISLRMPLLHRRSNVLAHDGSHLNELKVVDQSLRTA